MDRLHRRVQSLLWPGRLPEAPIRRRLLLIARYVYALLRDLADGELGLRAMSLVYTTMLAIAPLLAFSFSVAKGLGLHRELEPLLMNFLAPIGPQSAEVTANIIGFVDNISGSVLASVGIGLLLLSALSMAQKVERSFNFVWRVDRPRSFARRFTEYLSVMFVGPLLMSVTMGLIATLSSTTFVERMRGIRPLGAWIAGIGDLMPYALIIAAFSFLYVFIPNAKVRLRTALAGGLFAGVTWAASGQIFTGVVVAASRWEAIYSGFAIVIIVMIWMYVSWLILLLGAQLAFYLQNPEYLRLGQRTVTTASGLRERLALSVMLMIGRDFDTPAHGWRTESLAARIRVPKHLLDPIVTALQEGGLLTETTEQRLVPGRDPRRIQLLDILAAVRSWSSDKAAHDGQDWDPAVASLGQEIDAAIAAAVTDRSLTDLVDQDRAVEDEVGVTAPRR